MDIKLDLKDKNVEYALAKFASSLDVDTCEAVLQAYASCKAKGDFLNLQFDTGSVLEELLLFILSEYAPESEFGKLGKVDCRIGDASREQLLSSSNSTLLEIQRSIETVCLPAQGVADRGGVFVSVGIATWGRATSFLNDPKFLNILERYSDLLPLPNWHWNMSVALWCAKNALRLEGEFVELGVFKGHTTLFLAEYLGFNKVGKKWHLYDTFEGIPAEDMNNGSWVGINEGLYVDTYSYEEVVARFKTYPNIHVIKGRVPDVFADNPPPARIAFLHVDLNSARAEVAALEIIFDSVINGGMILFDDYGWASCDEQHQAINAWAKKKSVNVLELPTGQGLLVVTK
jgi:hypothetical protein